MKQKIKVQKGTSSGNKGILSEILNPPEILNLINEASGDLVFLLDKNGLIVFVNKKTLQILNFSSEEVLNKHFFEFIDEADKPEVTKSFCEVLKNDNVIPFNASLFNNEKKKIKVRIKCKSLRINNKIFAVLFAAGYDAEKDLYLSKLVDLENKMTETKRLLELERSRSKKHKLILEELNNLKTEFITNISHELRTPISSIVGFSDAIANDINLNEEHKKEFNLIILNEGKRLAKLIDDLLDETREEKGKPFLEKTEFDFNMLLREIITEMQEKIEEKSIIFSYEIPQKASVILGDKDRIYRAVYSLLFNSISYTQMEGRIKIIAKDYDNEYEIIISDTGIGLSGNEFSKIFDNTISIKQKHPLNEFGFGLILVKNVVDLHNGFISVQSEKDKGTTFLLKFPKNVDK